MFRIVPLLKAKRVSKENTINKKGDNWRLLFKNNIAVNVVLNISGLAVSHCSGFFEGFAHGRMRVY